MKVVVRPDPEAATAHAADCVLAEVAARPHSAIGLATGATMEPLYQRLATAPAGTFSRCRFFSLDEYLGLAASDPNSFHAYLDARFFGPVPFPRRR